jgi:class 3 adenylate cyclase
MLGQSPRHLVFAGSETRCLGTRGGAKPRTTSAPGSRNTLGVGASPAAAYALARIYAEMDLRDVLPTIRVATLLLRRTECTSTSRETCINGLRTRGSFAFPARMSRRSSYSPEILSELERFLSGVEEASGPDRVLITVLFTDLVGATARAAELGDSARRGLLARHHEIIHREIRRYRGREVDIAGDGLFAAFEGPARAIRCADAIRNGPRDLQLDVRMGVHTGECEFAGDKRVGIAVHTEARITAAAARGEILVSPTVKDLVAGSGISFGDRGKHALKARRMSGASTRQASCNGEACSERDSPATEMPRHPLPAAVINPKHGGTARSKENPMRILYFGTTGANDPTKASIPLHIAANGSVEAGQECAVVLAGDAVELVSRETAEGVEGVGIPPVRDLFRKLGDNEVAVYV